VISEQFDYISCSLILLNSILIGVQTDHQARHEGSPKEFLILNTFFMVIFFIELALRMYAHGRRFFCGAFDRWWNLFDLALVCIGTIEGIADLANPDSKMVRWLMPLRLVRILRVLRVMRFLSEVRKIVYLIWASLSSFFWASILYLMLTYIVALVILERVAGQFDAAETKKRFADSVATSFLILFQAITGGMDWGEVSSPLFEVSADLGMIFLLYVFFSVLVLLNLVTGVFVDGALKLAKEDKERDMLRKVDRAFRACRVSGRSISWQDLNDFWFHAEVQDLFVAIGINITRAEEFFNFLDKQGDGALTAEELANGAVNLQGPAKALDMAIMTEEMQLAMMEIKQMVIDLPALLPSRPYVSESPKRSTVSPLRRVADCGDCEV